MIWTSIKKNKNILMFILILFSFGIILGYIYFNQINDTYKNTIENYMTNLSNNLKISYRVIIYQILIIFLFVLSYKTIFLYPLTFFYLLYEGFSCGFALNLFITLFNFKGFILSIIFFVLTKLLFLIFLVILTIKLTKSLKIKIYNIIEKNNKLNLRTNYKFLFILLVILIIYNILIINLSSKLV